MCFCEGSLIMSDLTLIGNFIVESLTNFFTTLRGSWFGVALLTLILLDIVVSVILVVRGTHH